MILRRFLYWVLIALTWYLAGMYRSFPLLVLSIVELALYAGSLVLCRMLRRRLHVGFQRQKDSCEAGMPCRIDLLTKNASRLPVTRFGAILDMRYDLQKRGEGRVIWGSAPKGERLDSLEIRAPYAGLLRLALEEVRVYDWLSLSSSRRVTDDVMELFVFPQDIPLHLVWPAGPLSAAQSAGLQLRNDPGSAYEEIRQVREYQPGDPARHVHWNLSARTDSVWIREYEQQTDETVAVHADTGSEEAPDCASMDCFYRVLHSLLLGVLQRAAAVEVSWRNPEYAVPDTRMATDATGCRKILRAMYETPLPTVPQAPSEESGFLVNRRLELFRDGRLIHRFSPDGLDKELQDGIFEA